jgi:PAS domain S-box-containing protein
MEIAKGFDLTQALQTILDYFPSGVSLIDQDLNFVVWNKKLKELLEFPDELFEPTPPHMSTLFRFNANRGDYGPGDPEQQVEAGLARCRLMQAHVFERTRPDGTVLEVRGTPVPNGGFVSIYTDITQRKQAESQYRATLENASVGIMFTSDRKVQHCNPKFAEIFGWNSPEDLVGQPGSVFWLSEDVYAEIGKQAGPILSSGGTYVVECQLRRKDGSTFLGHLSAKAVNFTSTSMGTIWIGEDVTEIRAVERAIKESERHLSQIVDGSSIPTFVIDAEHRVTHWNQGCEKLTGISRNDVLGTTDVWRAFYPAPRPTMADLVVSNSIDETVQKYYQKFSHSTLIPGAFEAEDFFPQAGEGGRWLYFTAAPLHDSDGRLTGAIETLQDVTERRRAEKALEDRTQALEKAYSELGVVLKNLQTTQDELVRSEKLAALGSMVAGVAHELNTPIGNSLITATHVMEASTKMDDAMKTGLRRSMFENYMADIAQSGDILVRNLNKAAELVSSFKQVAVDQTSSQRREFGLAEVVSEIATMLAPTIRKTPYTLVQNIPDDIHLDSFPGPLGQILTNLINNAILHGFEGQDHGTITLAAVLAGEEGKHVTLSLSDDGRGIPEGVLPRIFDPFFTTKLGSGGSGLGLNIAHNMVTGILGGRIAVNSEVGKGTSFTITVPLNAPNGVNGIDGKRG